MPAEWRYRGRVVTAEDILFIRAFIAAHPNASRRRLSALLCEAWQWRQANGAPCDMICRGLLLMLHRAGEIELPAVRQLAATVYELEKLRCNLCGNVYTAEAPADAGEKKSDESAAAMIALLRYGSGVPWNRTEGLEANLGIPLPAATQCEIMVQTAPPLQPALEELKRQAAQAEVVHNDDTSMRVLSLDRDADISPERTGVFTSGLVWIVPGRRIGSASTSTRSIFWKPS